MHYFWIRGSRKISLTAPTVGVAVGCPVMVGLGVAVADGCVVVDGVGDGVWVAEGAEVALTVGVLVGGAVTVQVKVRSTRSAPSLTVTVTG